MRIFLSLLSLGLASLSGGAAEFGPEKGSLVIVGGAARDSIPYEKFVELAGGPKANIVVIPTAGGAKSYDSKGRGLETFREHGVTNLTLLHTYSRKEADTAKFVAPLKKATGVWFSGGRQWRLADSYLGTLVHQELWALLDRGGVIGGSSAGATIQGSYLARGDSKTNTIMMGDHEEGMAFLKQSAIDQHLLRRNRQFDLIEIIEAKPELLGFGIDENTAMVVQGDVFEVVGASYVAVYTSAGIKAGKPFYLVAPGQRYNLKERRPVIRRRPTR
jgi:cyanophycinase